MRLIRLAALSMATILPACASIMEGTSESLAINTTPPGAACNVDREGTRVGTVSPTPGSINVAKSKNDITVTCTLPGYNNVQVSTSPKFVGTTFGNIIAGGLIGVIVDASTGANYDLPDQVALTMSPSVAQLAVAVQPSVVPVLAALPGRPGS